MNKMFILDRNEEIVAILSGNADDSACHFFNSNLTLELNKGASLTFEVDTTEADIVQHIKEENMVVVNDGENYRLLIIKEVSDVHESDYIKEVYCEDASAELIDEIIYDEVEGKVEMGDVLKSILKGTRWEIGEVDNTYIRKLKPEFKLKSVLNGIQTLARQYDAEVDFIVEFAGNKITKRKVHMKKTFGRTLGKRFEFGKDTTSIKRTVNTADIKTAVIPFGATDEETGEVLTIEGVSWSKPNNPFNKPLGQTYIEDEEATELWGYKGTGDKRRARWIAITYEDCTDANELINYAQLQLNRFNKPKISYEASVVDLYRMTGDEEYSFEKVGLGDLVNIIDHDFVPALTLQSRIVKLELDLNDTSNSKVTIGTIVESIVDKDLKTQIEELNVKVSAVASDVDLSDVEDRLDKVESATGTGTWEQVQEVNNLLFGNAVGYHYMGADQGIWVFDKPVGQNPTKAVALKGGMIGLAKWDSQKQVWNVGTFIDGNSVNASMINTGTLKADRIQAGALTVKHFNQELKTIINSVGDKPSREEVTTSIQTAMDNITLSIKTNYSTKEETESMKTTAVTESKKYSDTKKAEAITQAGKDADSKVNSAKSDLTKQIDLKASKTDVYTKAETYTKSETDSAIKVAKDSINLGVSQTYETKTNVETKVSTTLTSAKSYADTKKTEAITQAGKDADSKVNSAKTELNNKIDLKASKTDVYTKTQTYTKSETDSAIKVAKDSINLGVSQTYETKTNVETKINSAVNNVQIGGRNLALGTGKAIGDVSSGNNGSPYSATDLFSGITAIKTNTAWSGRYFNLKAIAQRGGFKAGDNLVLSVYIKADKNVTLNVTSHRTKGTGNTAGSSKTYTNFTVTPKWQQVWFPFVADEGSLNRVDTRIEVNKETDTNYIHWAGWKLEKGTKPSDWTSAPEDVDSAIGTKANSADVYNKTEVYTKSQTDSAINVAKDNINLSVSNTYETKTNVSSQVNTALSSAKSYADTKKSEAINSANATTDTKLKSYSTTTQMNSAINVAKDSITNTVSKTYATKSDVESTYATKSSLTQTTDKIVAKFEASGGYNLLKNSKGQNGTNFWLNNGGGIRIDSDATFGTCMWTTAPKGFKYSEAIKLKNDTDYVYEGYVKSTQTMTGSKLYPLHYWCNTTPSVGGQPQLTVLDFRQGISKVNTWTKCYVHFRTASSGDVYFTPFVYVGGSTTFDFWVTELSLSESSVESKWTPHPDEIYSGSTVIDASGVTVNNGALRVKNNAGTTVLEGDSSGNLTMKNGCFKVLSSSNGEIASINQNNWMRIQGIEVFGAGECMQNKGKGTRSLKLISTDGSASHIDFNENSSTNYTVRLIREANSKNLQLLGNGMTFLPYTTNTACGLEVRSQANWSYIDFTSNATDDYHARLYTKNNDKNFYTAGAGLIVQGNLSVTGSKNCLQATQNYGERLINAYETTECYYGDLGFGTINSDGECIVYIDDIFQECTNTNIKYHVFTQAYNGAISIIERHNTYFIVKGTAGTEFSWEIKAKRINHENTRFDVVEIDNCTVDGLRTFSDADFLVETAEDSLVDDITFNLEDILMEE